LAKVEERPGGMTARISERSQGDRGTTTVIREAEKELRRAREASRRASIRERRIRYRCDDPEEKIPQAVKG